MKKITHKIAHLRLTSIGLTKGEKKIQKTVQNQTVSVYPGCIDAMQIVLRREFRTAALIFFFNVKLLSVSE